MRLLHFQVSAQTGGPSRGVSVWVDGDEPEQARSRAVAGLAAAGWIVMEVDSDETTTAEDYFRSCPSQQAFTRAQTDGVAWRFDDE